MADSAANGVYFGAPDGYVEPKWPGLYEPFESPNYLYSPYTIWRFTLLWTLLFHGVVFLGCGLLCFPIFARRHFQLSLSAPFVFTGIGLLGAFISATVVGYVLAALYNAAFLRMSTFVPALWGAVQTLVLLTTTLSPVRGML